MLIMLTHVFITSDIMFANCTQLSIEHKNTKTLYTKKKKTTSK